MLPGDVKPPEGGTVRRRQRAPRAPSMRTLIRWAQKCDSAEQLGERLKRRYDRQLQRRGLAPAGNARAEAELDRILGELDRSPQIFPAVLTVTAPRRPFGSKVKNPAHPAMNRVKDAHGRLSSEAVDPGLQNAHSE